MSVGYWDFDVRLFYGRASPAPGFMALETKHRGDFSKDMEVDAGKSRADIGRIDVKDRNGAAGWVTVYSEETP